MFNSFNKVIPPKVYFPIWVFNVVFFILPMVLFDKFTLFFQKNPFIVSTFASVYLGNIFIGVFAFLFGLASLVPKKKVDAPLNNTSMTPSPKKTYLVLFFVMLILAIIVLFLSNFPAFTKDTLQFSRTDLIECYIEGRQIMATRQDCQELSIPMIQPTSAPVYIKQEQYVPPPAQLKTEHTTCNWIGSQLFCNTTNY